MSKIFYRIKQVAEILNVSRSSVARLIDKNKIPAFRIENSVMILRKDLEIFIRELTGEKICLFEK